MSAYPAFYEDVRLAAATHWNLLEGDPVLAGPWHQLFMQVQSPRHVLSELFQNADDAGATEASVRIDGETFVFEHNGEDFSEDHFRSLCRFGYSNKRVLHTIGFRGIGFKSTFSLGDRVELYTPTISVCFHRERFTEPVWLPERPDTFGRTRVVVGIGDKRRQGEVEKNLEEWLKSPVSLLFFRNIRRIHIGDRELVWESLGPGPAPHSEWMALNGDADAAHLSVRSDDEAFPEDALEEIRQERLLGNEEDVDLPPCKVEIVSGAKGRLYVVLPTGIETALPFACNAPFIQDPSRREIKSPDSSSTNRWLLERIGRLAASAMLFWLDRTDIPTAERAWAYRLLPNVDRQDASLQGVCARIVEEAFAEGISGRPLLLTEDGKLVPEKQSVVIPGRLFEIWPDGRAAAILDEGARPALCRHVEIAVRKKLGNWGLVEEINRPKILETLLARRLPKPETWESLLKLWNYVAPDIAGYRFRGKATSFKIVPVQGQDVLHSAGETVRLGEKKLLQSEEDWEFLAGRLVAMDRDWPAFLADERRAASEREDPRSSKDVDAAHAVLEAIGLARTSDAAKAIEAAAEKCFSQDGVNLQGCVRLAQIAAKLEARVRKSFRYMTSDGKLHAVENGVLLDADGKLRDLIPGELRDSKLLHQGYTDDYSSCSREEWLDWISSGRSGLHTFMPLVSIRKHLGMRRALEGELKRRGYAESFEHRYKDPFFCIDDWNFEDAYWAYWRRLAVEEPEIWSVVFEWILAERESYWSDKATAEIVEQASNGHERKVVRKGVVPSWALAFQELPCLRDTHGFLQKPEDLFRRTPKTEALMDVEPFVDGNLDREATRHLLDLVGVQSTPTGPGRLLDRVRALAQAEVSPIQEVEKWYRRLDGMLVACSTEDAQEIRRAFRFEKLILTQNGVWEGAAGVFLLCDGMEMPGAEVVRSSVRDLQLWTKVGVADRPTAELAIAWLNGLPVGRSLEQDVVRRVRSLLSGHAARIWNECGHWLNLAGEWVAVESLSWSLTGQFRFHWQHLHRWVKQETADLQGLSSEIVDNTPFSRLPVLTTQVEDRLDRYIGPPVSGEKKEWLTTLGRELGRAVFDTDEETKRVRTLAERLVRTNLHYAPNLEIVPYIDGTPAGTPRPADVVWLDGGLYVGLLPAAKLARRIPEQIGKAFGRADIEAALHYSFERSTGAVREYLEENFNLSPVIAEGEEYNQEEVPRLVDGRKYPTAGGESGSDRVIVGPADNDSDAPTGLQGDDAADVGGGEAADHWETGSEVEQGLQRSPVSPKPARAEIIERFAESQGYQKESDQRFTHEDGSWIARSIGARFPWERRSVDGDIVRYYLPREHCLEREPLQIEADVWRLLEREPEIYALVLFDTRGGPIEVNGTRLRRMREDGEVILYPATYRLVYDTARTGRMRASSNSTAGTLRS